MFHRLFTFEENECHKIGCKAVLLIYRFKRIFMKINRQIIIALSIMIVTSALYRVMPGRPLGFAPQIAIALFSGSLFASKKQYSFLLPLLSMFISDLIYQLLFNNQLSSIQGFYSGQVENYLLIAATTVFGYSLQSAKPAKYIVSFLSAPTAYFLVSNFLVWAQGGGYHHPISFTGLMQTMVDGLPFYPYSLVSTIVFGAVLFGSFRLLVPKFKAI
jgi:hypothetical protein